MKKVFSIVAALFIVAGAVSCNRFIIPEQPEEPAVSQDETKANPVEDAIRNGLARLEEYMDTEAIMMLNHFAFNVLPKYGVKNVINEMASQSTTDENGRPVIKLGDIKGKFSALEASYEWQILESDNLSICFYGPKGERCEMMILASGEYSETPFINNDRFCLYINPATSFRFLVNGRQCSGATLVATLNPDRKEYTFIAEHLNGLKTEGTFIKTPSTLNALYYVLRSDNSTLLKLKLDKEGNDTKISFNDGTTIETISTETERVLYSIMSVYPLFVDAFKEGDIEKGRELIGFLNSHIQNFVSINGVVEAKLSFALYEDGYTFYPDIVLGYTLDGENYRSVRGLVPLLINTCVNYNDVTSQFADLVEQLRNKDINQIISALLRLTNTVYRILGK